MYTPPAGDEPTDNSDVPSWLTDEERRVWFLEGFDRLPAAVSIPVASRFLGVSRSTGYCLVHDGTLNARRLRRRLVIPRFELFRILHVFRVPPPEAET